MDYLARLHLVSKPKNKDLIIRHLYDAVEKKNWKPNPNDTKQQQKQDKNQTKHTKTQILQSYFR